MDEVDQLAMIFKALSDPTRLRLLKLLNQNATTAPHPHQHHESCNGGQFLCVNAMAHHLGVTQSAVSQHLRILKQAGLVNGERHGHFMHYSLDRAGLQQYGEVLQETLGVSFAIEG